MRVKIWSSLSINKSSAVAEMGDHLATIDMGWSDEVEVSRV